MVNLRVGRRAVRLVVPLFAAALAGGLTAVVGPATSLADTSDEMCPTVRWDGADAAGTDRAYRVAAPGPDQGDETRCYVASKTVTAANTTRPIYLVAGYQMADRPGDPGTKSLIYVQIQCFDAGGQIVFKQSVNSNIWDGMGEKGYYPRALLYPPAEGSYDCGVRVVNHNMGQPPVPVYATSGYLSVQPTTTDVHGQQGSVDPAVDPPLFGNGDKVYFVPYGHRAQLRRVQLTVDEGVDTLRASSNVNFTECSPGTWNQGDGPCPDKYRSGIGSQFRLRIVAWQQPTDPDGEVCYIAAPDANVPWTRVSSDAHHRGLKIDADLTLTDDPACRRTVVIKTVLEMTTDQANYDPGFAHTQFTVLSVLGR